MNDSNTHGFSHVVIVGAGTVGLFLGCCLHYFGLTFTMLERRKDNRGSSRAIGIHPPSLEIFARLGLVDRLLAKGVRVQVGKACSGTRELGEISFAGLPLPFNFVLSVPQYETEKLLEEHLNKVAPGCIKRDAHVESFEERDGRLNVRGRFGGHGFTEVAGAFMVACDGMNSAAREKAHIEFEGGQYDDTFVMGDFEDKTAFGLEARIFLDDHGFIESFPLPNGIRRWVMQTEKILDQPDESAFVRDILSRTGQNLEGTLSSLLSSFAIHHYVASTFVKGRVLLAGDAAHVMSPIGGQGMNVGWMDALDIASALHHIFETKTTPDAELAAYNEKARARAHKAIARSEIYMSIGRRGQHSWLKRLGLSMALKTPARNIAAEYFTMGGL